MGPTQVCDYCHVDETGCQLLAEVMRQMNLSAQAHYCVLKLAWTLAAPSSRLGRAWRGRGASGQRTARSLHKGDRRGDLPSVGRGAWSSVWYNICITTLRRQHSGSRTEPYTQEEAG